jgi:hypothetical protein
MLRYILVDGFAFLAFVFNGLLIYSLVINKDSVSDTVWTYLVIREIFGFICFTVTYSQKWLSLDQRVRRYSFNFWFYMVYFVLLFGFALVELVIMVKHMDDAMSGTLPLTVFAWFFVVIDWLVIFSIFTMGICVYEDSIPRYFLGTAGDEGDVGSGDDEV